MKMEERINAKFCKDMNIPISLHMNPYFKDRLETYDKYKPCLSDYALYRKTLSNYRTFEDFAANYNNFKDSVIKDLWDKPGVKKLSEEDHTKFIPIYKSFPKKDIFKNTNANKIFMSIDIVKANFSALRHYDSEIVDNKNSYEDYVRQFTDIEYFVKSKYIRQVIFGNINTKRIIMYERFLIDKVVEILLKYVKAEEIVSVSNDEIVIDTTNICTNSNIFTLQNNFLREIYETIPDFVPLKLELYSLRVLANQFQNQAYVKEFLDVSKVKAAKCDDKVFEIEKVMPKSNYEFKCVNSLDLPFILKKYLGEEVTENDKIFQIEGKLAKLIDIPVFEKI